MRYRYCYKMPEKCECVKPEELASPVNLIAISPLLPLLTQIYNTGYNNGHNDTVESCYTDVLPIDTDSYQSDVVEELVEDLLGS